MKQVSGKALVKIAADKGWILARIKGSHHIMTREGDDAIVVIPVHENKPLKTGTLRSIMKTAGITESDL